MPLSPSHPREDRAWGVGVRTGPCVTVLQRNRNSEADTHK